MTDGTSAGTHEITGGANASSNGLNPGNFIAYNGGMLFEGYDASSGNPPFGSQTLWTTDGTSAGTHELAVQGASAAGLRPSQMTLFNGKVVFTGHDAKRASLLCGQRTARRRARRRSPDRGTAGTASIPVPSSFTMASCCLTRQAPTATMIFGKRTARRRARRPSPASREPTPTGPNPCPFANYNGKVLVNIASQAGLATLWITDGTAAGTQEIMAQGANTTPGAVPQSHRLHPL